MAEKRMFAKTIIDSDAFLDMPLSSQALYFHLSMRADDEGFINNPKKIQRTIGCSEDDLKLLIMKNFIIPFESGIVVIKHWRIHNYIRKDRIQETVYKDEKALLDTKENGAYTLELNECQSDGSQLSGECPHRLDKIRLDKISIDIDNTYSAFFEKMWKLYPNKKGKGQVSDSKKEKLFNISEEEMIRAIDRYKKELEKDKKWRKPQNGSTFFNSGYIDYLDANFEPSKEEEQPTPKLNPKIHNFQERVYTPEDYSAMEQIALGRQK